MSRPPATTRALRALRASLASRALRQHPTPTNLIHCLYIFRYRSMFAKHTRKKQWSKKACKSNKRDVAKCKHKRTHRSYLQNHTAHLATGHRMVELNPSCICGGNPRSNLHAEDAGGCAHAKNENKCESGKLSLFS
jgi:hypothetical protein